MLSQKCLWLLMKLEFIGIVSLDLGQAISRSLGIKAFGPVQLL
jgi:hypothetical protein